MASTSTKTLIRNRLRSRHGSLKSTSTSTRRPPSPDSACEHDSEWMIETVCPLDDVTSSDLSEEGNEKSCIMGIRKVTSVDHRRSDVTTVKGAAGQDSDVDSGIVACRKVGERIGSTSSADTDSSQESRPRNEYSPPIQKIELTKPRSYTGSLRVPRHQGCLSSGPVKGDHLALRECNRRPPTPLTIFPDSHHCVRFDEQLQLSEQNIRRSCRKLFATLYAQRFSYPSHQDNTSLHGRNHSVYSRNRSRTAPELELRRYSPVSVDIQLKNAKEPSAGPDEEKLYSKSDWCHRIVHKSVSDVTLVDSVLPSPTQQYKSQVHNDLPGNEVSRTTSTDSGLGSLRNSSHCACHNRQSISSSPPKSISSCFYRCSNCKQLTTETVENIPKLFKSSSCSTLSTTLSHQSRPQLTQFPPRTVRKTMSKTPSCSNLLDRHSTSSHAAKIPVYPDKMADNMVHAYAHVASVIPEDLKQNYDSLGVRRSKTLRRFRHTNDNVFEEKYPLAHSVSYSTSPLELPRCLGRRGSFHAEALPRHIVPNFTEYKNNSELPHNQNLNFLSEIESNRQTISAEIYSQIDDEAIRPAMSSFGKKSVRNSVKVPLDNTAIPKRVNVVNPNRGSNKVHLKSALKKPTQSAMVSVNDLAELETQVKELAVKPTEVEYAMVDKTKKDRCKSMSDLKIAAATSQVKTEEIEENDPPVPPKKKLHKSDFTLYRSRSSSPKKSLFERVQTMTKNAKTALQKAFSTERIYRPEKEERMDDQKGLQRSKSFMRQLAGSFRKKRRRNRTQTSPEVVHQQSSNPEPSNQQSDRVLGLLIQLNPDGSQVVEISKPSSKPYGFFIARGRVKNSKGVFVSRFRDEETKNQLASILEIGDEILEIDGISVKDADVVEVNNLMYDKDMLLLTIFPIQCRKEAA